MSEALRVYLDGLVFLFGAAIGSFLNVCIYRMPRGLSLIYPPSSCPHCQHPIRWYHNVPLVSYLALAGKCRYCGARITPRYFLVELLTAVAFLAVWWKFGSWLPVIYWILLSGLIVATFIDFEHYIIPNEITLGGIVVGVVASALYPPLHDAVSVPAAVGQSLLGILCGGGLLYAVVEAGKWMFGRRKLALAANSPVVIADGKLRVGEEELPWEEMFFRASDRITFRAATLQCGDQTWKDVDVVVTETQWQVCGETRALNPTERIEATTDFIVIPREAMGLGDVKLLAAIGAFLGWKATLFTVFFSSVLGGLVGLALILLRRLNWQGRIPYGPYLVVGAVVWIFFGQQLVYWYMNLLRG